MAPLPTSLSAFLGASCKCSSALNITHVHHGGTDKIYVYVLSPEAVNPVVHVFNQGIGTALIVRYAPTTSSKMLENISFLSSIIARSKESRMSISPANRWLSKKITKGRK